jgi:hypothetical protein
VLCLAAPPMKSGMTTRGRVLPRLIGTGRVVGEAIKFVERTTKKWQARAGVAAAGGLGVERAAAALPGRRGMQKMIGATVGGEAIRVLEIDPVIRIGAVIVSGDRGGHGMR